MRKFRCIQCLSVETALGISFLSTNVLIGCRDCLHKEVLFYGDNVVECEKFIDDCQRLRANAGRYACKWRRWKMSKLRFVQYGENQPSRRDLVVFLSQMRERMVSDPDYDQLALL